MRRWFRLAFSKPILVRSLKVSIVVGTILTLINQGGAILGNEESTGLVAKVILTYLTPYLVSTYASVQSAINTS